MARPDRQHHRPPLIDSTPSWSRPPCAGHRPRPARKLTSNKTEWTKVCQPAAPFSHVIRASVILRWDGEHGGLEGLDVLVAFVAVRNLAPCDYMRVKTPLR